MKTLREELAEVLSVEDEAKRADAIAKFCQRHSDRLPLPGEDSKFDKAMWAASEYMNLSKKDEGIVARVTERLLAQSAPAVEKAVLKMRDLVGSARETAIAAWQEMLAATSWQQMVPAGALRGVGAQMVSLGTFQKDLGGANIQVNLGWMVDQDNLRILVQAKDAEQEALPEVELRIKEADRGVVFSRKTNQDGAMVAPSVKVEPGKYQLEILWNGQTAETPYFLI